MPSAYYISLLFPWELPNSVQILQGDISFIIQYEMPGISAAFMDESMSEGLLLGTKPTAQDGIYPLFCGTPNTPSPILCGLWLQTSHASAQMVNTLAWIINTMRHSRKHWDPSVHLGHLNDNKLVLQHVKNPEKPFQVEMTPASQKCCSCGHCCIYEGRYPEDRKVQKILD